MLAENVLKSIPVYGTFFSISIDTVKAVRVELEKELPASVEEMLSSVGALSSREARQAIQSVLDSPQGALAFSTLTKPQATELRRRLKALPDELTLLLREIEAKEAKARQHAVDSKRQARENELARLHARLAAELKAGSNQQAYATASKILSLSPRDRSAARVESFLIQRINGRERKRAAFFLSLTMIVLITAVARSFYRSERDVVPLAILSILVSIALIFLILRVWPFLHRDLRKLLGVLCFLLAMAGGILLMLGASALVDDVLSRW